MKFPKTHLLTAVIAFVAFAHTTSADERMQSYEDCTITYDEKRGESSGSGTNSIVFRTARSTWAVSYSFGNGNYLILGGGNLEGKTINVRFENGIPTSLKSTHGSGSCRVNSASRK